MNIVPHSPYFNFMLVVDTIFNEKKKDYDVYSYDDEELSFDDKKRAVEYWRSGKTKKNRSIESVKHRFKLVNSEWQLRRWASQINKGGTYKEKLYQISEFV